MRSQSLRLQLAGKWLALTHLINSRLTLLAPLSDVILKLWVANVFFKSSLTKIQSFDTTIMLFSEEYTVPILSPSISAFMATGIKLVFPVLLVIG